ncbi:MAG: hypothetical protein H6659_18330 [Ardenticatenaceae bacterium]|nr:hypothetical protein [Ardenticatenaceae bacterium]
MTCPPPEMTYPPPEMICPPPEMVYPPSEITCPLAEMTDPLAEMIDPLAEMTDPQECVLSDWVGRMPMRHIQMSRVASPGRKRSGWTTTPVETGFCSLSPVHRALFCSLGL